jgi:hypothetical protein
MKPKDLFNNEAALLEGQTKYTVLSRAYTLLLDEDRWARRAYARDAEGRIVKPGDPAARCWDMQGAIAVSCNKWGILPPCFMYLLNQLAKDYGFENYSEMNDGVEHQGALNILLEALRRTT